MASHTCRVKGVCSRSVSFELDEQDMVRSISFAGGCSGNLQGVAALAEGRPAREVIGLVKGIRCGGKSTSCPDQFAKALEETLKKR